MSVWNETFVWKEWVRAASSTWHVYVCMTVCSVQYTQHHHSTADRKKKSIVKAWLSQNRTFLQIHNVYRCKFQFLFHATFAFKSKILHFLFCSIEILVKCLWRFVVMLMDSTHTHTNTQSYKMYSCIYVWHSHSTFRLQQFLMCSFVYLRLCVCQYERVCVCVCAIYNNRRKV